jgi:hypothetical protein
VYIAASEVEDNELGSFETAWIDLVLFARGRPAQSFPFGVRCFLRFAQDDQPQRQRRQACLSPAGVAGVDDDLVRLVVDRQSPQISEQVEPLAVRHVRQTSGIASAAGR